MGVLGWVLAGQEEAGAVRGVHNELGHLEGIWGDWQTLPALVQVREPTALCSLAYLSWLSWVYCGLRFLLCPISEKDWAQSGVINCIHPASPGLPPVPQLVSAGDTRDTCLLNATGQVCIFQKVHQCKDPCLPSCGLPSVTSLA